MDNIEEDRVGTIFFPYAIREFSRFQATGRRFVHYTSADVAHSIIENRRVWMRNARAMNDFSEIQYGRDCLEGARKRGFLGKFSNALDNVHAMSGQKALENFEKWHVMIHHNTFLACLSEHLDEEDAHGRLSMWRAYGRANGVALVLRPGFLDNPPEMNVFTSPVMYGGVDEISSELAEITRNIEENADYLRTVESEEILNRAFMMLRAAVLCTKHPGFREEKEWRVIYSPDLGGSPSVEKSTESVSGIPQAVYKLKLENKPEFGIQNVDIREIVDSVIIGPTEFPMMLRETFFDALKEQGVTNPGAVVRQSGIPLRRS